MQGKSEFPLWVLAVLCGLAVQSVHAQAEPKYSAKVPPYITTPDSVETRIGTLKFFDGQPDPETVRKAYDNLDFVRGVEAFLSGIPAASVYAVCEGLSGAGVKRNTHYRHHGRLDGCTLCIPNRKFHDRLCHDVLRPQG